MRKFFQLLTIALALLAAIQIVVSKPEVYADDKHEPEPGV